MDPAPQGSKTLVGINGLRESCRRVKPWRQLVTISAVEARLKRIPGPVRMDAEFIFRRPASHLRRDGSLKPSAPRWHAVRPDGSKLLRSTEDALTGILYDDDSRIVASSFTKRYCEPGEQPGAIITIQPLPVPPQ